MTTTLIHPHTVVDELTTNTLSLPPRGKGRGEGLDKPRRPLHQPSPPQPNPQSPDSKPAPRDLLNRLLTLYTTHSNSLNDLCRELELSMLELLDLLERPEVTRALERLAQASETRAKVLARITSDSAVSALIDLMDTTDKPETRRKSAGALLRHGSLSRAGGRERVDRASDPGEGRDQTRAHNLATDTPPPPRGEGRGEGLGLAVARTPAANRTGGQAASGTHHATSQAA